VTPLQIRSTMTNSPGAVPSARVTVPNTMSELRSFFAIWLKPPRGLVDCGTSVGEEAKRAVPVRK
jgi:hypothetical protein